MAASRSTTERESAALQQRLDSLAKKPSTASQEHEVGVKSKTRSTRPVEGADLRILWA